MMNANSRIATAEKMDEGKKNPEVQAQSDDSGCQQKKKSKRLPKTYGLAFPLTPEEMEAQLSKYSASEAAAIRRRMLISEKRPIFMREEREAARLYRKEQEQKKVKSARKEKDWSTQELGAQAKEKVETKLADVSIDDDKADEQNNELRQKLETVQVEKAAEKKS